MLMAAPLPSTGVVATSPSCLNADGPFANELAVGTAAALPPAVGTAVPLALALGVALAVGLGRKPNADDLSDVPCELVTA
jgi:hypothetical protein